HGLALRSASEGAPANAARAEPDRGGLPAPGQAPRGQGPRPRRRDYDGHADRAEIHPRRRVREAQRHRRQPRGGQPELRSAPDRAVPRSEEHTSELQSLAYLVCRLLLEKKKKKTKTNTSQITNIPHKTFTTTFIRLSQTYIYSIT